MIPYAALTALLAWALTFGGPVHSIADDSADAPPAGARKIGLLVPTTGPDRTLGKQAKVGTQLGIDALRASMGDELQISLRAWEGDLAGPEALRIGYEALQAEGVDVIVGGVTPTAAAELRAIAMRSSVPTIVLADSGGAGGLFPPASHILQIGLSQEEVDEAGIMKWIHSENLGKLAVLFDMKYPTTLRYGGELMPGIIKSLSNPTTDFSEVFFNSDSTLPYDYEIEAVEAYGADGIVMSAMPWDASRLVAKAADKLGAKPIYVTPPSATKDQIRGLASNGIAPIYYGTQFWLSEDNPKAGYFLEELRRQLDWQADVDTTVAIEAYDATQLLGKVWELAGSSDWSWTANPWEGITSVQGLTGELTLQGDFTLAGPLTLIKAMPGGNFEGLALDPW